ncbi:MAG: Flp pilus assembly complex ATPase component TadA [Deltaproteobacteria bacterium]|nr:Flp pilus assembly complex ATPase component TadA [Deltaproteobacteria bacterium]MBN2672274.1 Flp pilus assembly complex ATPase component TadA [Deltaproteobacteria bacterium]
MTQHNSRSIHIEIRKGARSVGEYRFSHGDTATIGRNPQCHIVLDAKEVSRHHGTFNFDAIGFRLDNHSRNGIQTAQATSEGIIAYNTACFVGPYQLLICSEDNNHSSAPTADFRKDIMERLIDELNLNLVRGNPQELAYRVESALDRILAESGVSADERCPLRETLRNEAIGLGPLEPLLKDDTVSEIMVVTPRKIYVEKNGVLKRSEHTFSCESSVRTVIDRILAPLGRRIDESSPMVDARLPDGSRVNAVIPPLALRGSSVTIRKFSKHALSLDDLIAYGSLNREMAELLKQAVRQRQNIVISGGTGSGKTTLLNVLSAQIPDTERIVTIEDAAELQLHQPHVVSLEAKPANSEGRGEVTIRDLVKNALRMRPDRIIIGECRGKEALDMLQAMNTGHDGSLTTTHANSPKEAMNRLETLTLMAGLDLPSRAIREQIIGAVQIVLQQKRFPDGARRITAISELCGIDDEGRIQMTDIWRFAQSGDRNTDFVSTGWIPRFILQGKRK